MEPPVVLIDALRAGYFVARVSRRVKKSATRRADTILPPDSYGSNFQDCTAWAVGCTSRSGPDTGRKRFTLPSGAITLRRRAEQKQSTIGQRPTLQSGPLEPRTDE